MTSIQVGPATIQTICQTLESIIAKSFGPNPSQSLLSTSTGQMLITSDGITIIQSLHLSHPVAKLIVDSVTAYHKQTGDGCKTFILLLSAFFRELTSRECNRCDTFYRSLGFVCSKFQSVLQEVVIPELSRLACKISGEHRTFQTTCHEICRTFFQGKIPDTTAEKLTSLLCEFIEPCMSCPNIAAQVDELCKNFSNTCVKVTGCHSEKSEVVEGIVILRDFAVDSGLVEAEMPLTYIILTSPLCDVISEISATVTLEVRRETQVQTLFEWQQSVVNNILASHKTLGVNLILSTSSISDMAKQVCAKFNISFISHIPEEQATYLQNVTGVFPVEHGELPASEMLGSASSCKTLIVNGRKCIQLEGLKSQGLVPPKQILLCAQTDSLCTMYEMFLYNAMKSVNLWVKSEKDKVSQEPVVNASFDSPVISSEGDENCSNDSSHLLPFENCSVQPSIANGILPGGGTPELLICRILEEFSKTCQDHALASFCKILERAYLEVPKVLYESTKKSSSSPTFLESHHEFLKDFESRNIHPFVQIRKNYMPKELVTYKVVTLQSLIGLLGQLLRLDRIVM